MALPIPSALSSAPIGAPPVAPVAYSYPPHGVPFAQPYAPAFPIPAAPRRSAMAVAGFCVGIAAIFPGVFLTWVGTIIGVCGLIFSVIGLRETGRHAAIVTGPRTGRTLAILGAVFSLIGIALSIALLIYIFNHLADFGIVWPPERTR